MAATKTIGLWELTQDDSGVRATRRFPDGRTIVASIKRDEEELWIEGAPADTYVPVVVVAQLIEWHGQGL